MMRFLSEARDAWKLAFRSSAFKREARLRARQIWLRFGSGLGLGALIFSLLWLCLPSLCALWTTQLEFWQHHIGAEYVGLFGRSSFAPAQQLSSLLGLPAPLVRLCLFFDAPLPSISAQAWQSASLGSLLLFATTFLGTLHRFTPALRVLRLIAAFALISVALSWFKGAPLISLSAHLLALQHFNLSLLLATPLLLAGSFYLMESSWRRRITGSALMLAYQIMALPFQLLAHSLLLHWLGPLAAPTLFLVFGPAMSVLAFAAILGWVMSRDKPHPLRKAASAASHAQTQAEALLP